MIATNIYSLTWSDTLNVEAQEANFHKTLYWGCRWTGSIRRSLDKLRLGRFQLQTVCGSICLRDYDLWLASASSRSGICWNHTHTYVYRAAIFLLRMRIAYAYSRKWTKSLQAIVGDCRRLSATIGDSRRRSATVGDDRWLSAIVCDNLRQLSNSTMIWAQKSALLAASIPSILFI